VLGGFNFSGQDRFVSKRNDPLIRPLRAALMVLGLMRSLIFGAESPAAQITRIEDIRRLSQEKAARSHPVKISGVCAFSYNGDLVVHDGSHGIWIGVGASRSRGLLQSADEFDSCAVGTAVEIDGVTDPGGYAPQILPVAIRKTGVAPLPAAVEITAEQLIAGSEDSQHVALEGVVQNVEILDDRTVCALVAEGVNCRVTLWGKAREQLPQLVDARVRVRGIYAPDFNSRAEVVLPKLISSSPNAFEVLVPPPSDPFSAPRVPVGRLRAFSPDSSFFHRRVTSGLITFVKPGNFFFLRDGNSSIRVTSTEPGLQVGWRVEVAGFVDTSEHFAALKNGIVRKIGESAPPLAERSTAAELLQSATRSPHSHIRKTDLSGRKVTLRGRIRRVDWTSPLSPMTVWLESGNLLFSAHLPPGCTLGSRQAASWQNGAEAELTGVCDLEFRSGPDPLGLYDPVGLHLWLASADDFAIVRQAPWWTTNRLFSALGLMTALAVLGVSGTLFFRRIVRKQALSIGEKLSDQAVHKDRHRIARDIHDDLGANLAQIAMLSELAHSDLDEPSAARGHLNKIFDTSKGLARKLDETVWAINPSHDSLDAIVAFLGNFAQEHFRLAGIRCRFDMPDTLPELTMTSAVRHNLFLAAKEAVQNIVKHSGATEARLRIQIEGADLLLSLEDNGMGGAVLPAAECTPAKNGNGLANMKHRMESIGGRFELESKAGEGTTVRLVLSKAGQ
jgi:signal transduction histidine kinase